VDDTKRGEKSQMEVRAMPAKTTCASCKYFRVKGAWEMCALWETVTLGQICTLYVDKKEHDTR
jgi:nicotinic acid phosphoribosyltransferase